MQRRNAVAVIGATMATFGLLPSALIRRLEAAPGSLLEFDERGIPYRASIEEDSPYYWPNYDVRVTLDGKVPGACKGWDRRAGYVDCCEVEGGVWWWTPEHGFPSVILGQDGPIPIRRYGKVETSWTNRP